MQQLKAKVINQFYKEGKYHITIESDTKVSDKYCECDISVDVKSYRKSRSMDANAYYWVLISKLSGTLGQSQPWLHNDMIRKYGQVQIADGQAVTVIIPDTEESEKDVAEKLEYHLRPTSQVIHGKDGQPFRVYLLMRGSSTYDTREFSDLLNGLVQECKALGIDVMTPNQLQELEGYERSMRSHR